MKNKMYVFISVLSLVLGITCFFFIGIWAKNELSYDADFFAAEHTYRVEAELKGSDGHVEQMSSVGWPVGKFLQQDYPEIEAVSYVRTWVPTIRHKDAYYNEEALMADQQFIDVVGLPMVAGNPEIALVQANTLIISQSAAKKYFEGEDAMGKTLLLNDTVPYTVTGVFGDLPAASHLKFDMVASLASVCSDNTTYCDDQYTSGWFDMNMYNYVKLQKGADPHKLEARIKNLVELKAKKYVEEYGYNYFLSLRPFRDVYLHSNMATGFGTIGNFKMVKLYLGIGVFILLIACFNFINLTTVRSMDRAKEIGVQKVLGNIRKKLIFHFLTETALLTLIAAIISIVLMLNLIPMFNELSGKAFTKADLLSPGNLLILAGILFIIVPLSGFYPAMVLSAYNPIVVLKGKFSRSASGSSLRKVLVGFQIMLSVGFMISILVVWKQLDYMRSQDLGFKKENLVVADVEKLPWDMRHQMAPGVKNALLAIPGVTGVTTSNAVPGRAGWDGQFAYAEGNPKEKGISIEFIPVDDDFVKTIGLKVIAGRDFIKGSEADVKGGLIINESAVKLFGWQTPENAIGKRLSTSGIDGRVVGVVKDYHQHGLKRKIGGVVLSPIHYMNLFAVRYGGNEHKVMYNRIKQVLGKFFNGYSIELKMLDEYFQRQYRNEQRFQRHIEIAAIVSLVICFLGLLGLSVYTVQQRTKEISIRRVLGAGTISIISALSSELFWLAAAGMLIGMPLAWWAMSTWLQQYAYRVEPGIGIFLFAGLITMVIAMATVALQSARAAVDNPLKSLRSE